ncbi:MAG: ATP-binding cassette domain-containing protein [Acidobacteriota bacterium]
MIRLESVSKRFDGDRVAMEKIDLHVAQGEFMVLLGESGCGKTTTLRSINRLVEITAGRILVEGSDIRACDPVTLRRSMGYVIQGIGLFPHMSVAENVAVVPRLLGWSRPRIARRVEELLQLIGLPPEEYALRSPRSLSGGQRQRIGLTRALAAEPRIMLMDEPFGAVDPIARGRLQEEYVRLHRTLGLLCLGSLGFENAYALAMRREHARDKGIRSIADLSSLSRSMKIGGDYEFFGRPEWRDLEKAYGLAFAAEVSFDPTFMYQAVARGDVDVISAFTSDGRIKAFELVLLEDPAQVIPPYNAILLLSRAASRRPAVVKALSPLVGAISLSSMRRASEMVDHGQETRTVAEAVKWLASRLR